MIQIENIEVFGWRHALRNMRNPKESWAKSDTKPLARTFERLGIEALDFPAVGTEDQTLLSKLVRGGTEHRKVLRTVKIWCDLVAWRGLWQEIDTYKIGTVRNSCSTMHKLGYRELTPADFQDQDVDPATLKVLNDLGGGYRATGCRDKKLLIAIKHRLPEGFLQRAGLSFNYEVALTMFMQRRNHVLPEWRWTNAAFDKRNSPEALAAKEGKWPSICDMLWALPAFPEIAKHDYRFKTSEEGK